MFHLSHSRRDIVRFVSFALALIALTVSLTLLSRWSSAASAGFNQKLNNFKAGKPAHLSARANTIWTLELDLWRSRHGSDADIDYLHRQHHR